MRHGGARVTRRIGPAALAAILSGCARGPEPIEQVPVSPVVRGADSGLELRWWVLPDDGDVIARALSPFEGRPGPVEAGSRELWRANGMRIVAVPVADLGALRAHLQQLRTQVIVSDLRAAGVREIDLPAVVASMGLAPVAQEQWLGEVPRWTDAVRGPEIGGGTGRPPVVMMDTGPLPLGPGRLRLLVRSWVEPVRVEAAGVPAGLRVELAPQFQESDSAGAEGWEQVLEEGFGPALSAEDEGLVFARLALSMTLDGSEALVIVPERPDSDWGRIAAGFGTPAAEPGVFGPAAPMGVTIGEAMLSAEAGESDATVATLPRRPAKAMIVLVPRVPERFELAR